MNPKVVAVLVAATLPRAPVASADLAAMSWQQFLSQSDVVLLAIASDLRITAEGGGSAKLLVAKVLRGAYQGETVSVTWGAEVHDQRIDRLGTRYVLFLEQTGQGYGAAGYGRSYWPVEVSYLPEAPDKSSDVVFYQYPITEVVMPADLVVTVPQAVQRWPEPALAVPRKAILLSTLTAAMERAR
jgi:hypothetical protein